MQFISIAVIWKRIKALKYFIKDPKVSKLKKLLVIFGIVYLLAPIDFVPIVIPVFGLLDDFVLWTFILTYLSDELDKYPDSKIGKAEVRYNKKGKDIYETTGEEVNDDIDENNEGE